MSRITSKDYLYFTAFSLVLSADHAEEGMCATSVYMARNYIAGRRNEVTFGLHVGCLHFEFVLDNMSVSFTVSDDGQDSQVHLSFPIRAFLQSDAVPSGGKDVPKNKTNTLTFITR